MDDYDFSDREEGPDIGWMTPILVFSILVLALFTSMLSLIRHMRTGPGIGEVVIFDRRGGSRYWDEPGLRVTRAASDGGQTGQCVLMPRVMAAEGGRLVLEVKETTSPPTYRAHWSGTRTSDGHEDCGKSADLTLRVVDVRALTRAASAWGAARGPGLF